MEGYATFKQSDKKGEWLRVQIISEKNTRKFKAIPGLFRRPVFIAVSVTELIWILFILLQYWPHEVADIYINLSASEAAIWILFMAFFSTVHECGHVSALLHCGGIPGGIGVSLYYLLPRAWSEVDDTWRLPEKERLYVNLGGIYAQLLVTMIVFFLNVCWIDNRAFLAASISSVQMALINLIPNRGMDGYWFLKDTFGIENINESAAGILKKPFKTKSEQGRNIIIVVFIIRNAVLTYLLLLAVIVSSTALTELHLYFKNGLMELGYSSTMLYTVHKRTGCFLVLTVVLQNVITSIILLFKHENAL